MKHNECRCSDNDAEAAPAPVRWYRQVRPVVSYNGTVWLTPSTTLNYAALDYTAYTAPGVIVLDEDVF